MNNPRAAAAIFYAEFGWPVLPNWGVGPGGACACPKPACRDAGKHPIADAVPRGLNDASQDHGRIADWWDRWPGANVGIRTGAGAGIVVLDVDVRHGGDATLAALERRHGRLPRTVRARSGSGGPHIFFRHPGPRVACDGRGKRLGRGIDVRGDGGQLIAPPSRNAKGTYQWADDHGPGQVDVAELPAWLIPPLTQQSPDTDATERQKATSASLPLCFSASLWHEFPLLDRTLPKREGERNARLLDLARVVKFNMGLADRPAKDLEPIVREWHRRAVDAMGTKAFSETWIDFKVAFRAARHPFGTDVAGVAWALASASPAPDAAAPYADSPGLTALVGLCAAMQGMNDGHPFGLSCHQAARLVGADAKTVNRWLRGLEEDGVLECVERGKPGPAGSKATRWRFLPNGGSAA